MQASERITWPVPASNVNYSKSEKIISPCLRLGGTYFNGGSWVSTGAYEPTSSKKIPVVSTSSFAVIDLFDPDNLNSTPGVASMQITWNKADASCMGNANLEVSYGYWTVVGGIPQLPDEADGGYVILPKDGSGNITVGPLDPSRSYRFRFRSFDCAAANVNVSLYDSASQPKSFPGDITLGAEGTFNKTTQKITVTMPKQDVLSGLFGFVIFSECTLVKGPDAQICPP
jgi:hypothetical protein